MRKLSKHLFLIVTALTVLFAASSCNKKAVHKVEEDFVGQWKHVESDYERWYLDIGDNSYA